jgi:hypothetical protein
MFMLPRCATLSVATFLSVSAVCTPAATFQEDFSTSPATRGWETFGETALFSWNAEHQNLEVTWDSARPNSYFYHPLVAVLTRADDFTLAFDLRLDEISAGTFELALGFFNLANATANSFLRGTGTDSPNLVEFDYFPEWTSINATTCDSSNVITFQYDARLPLTPGEAYHIVLRHKAGDAVASAGVYTNNVLYSDLPQSYASPGFGDFKLDAIAVMSYNDKNSFGNLFAKGIVDNFMLETPSSPSTMVSGSFAGTGWEVRCPSAQGWDYTLQRSGDLETWEDVQGPVPGTGEPLSLIDSQPPAERSFYRVRLSP